MKKIVLISLIGVMQGCSAFCPQPPTTSQPSGTSPVSNNPPSSPGGKTANYEIRWAGRNGAKATVSYTSISANAPYRTEEFEVTLPYSTKFSAAADADITAYGYIPEDEEYTVRIFKDGAECTQKPNVVSNTKKPPMYRTCNSLF